MLHEISNVKQKSQWQFRRWFTDNDMDLFVWFSRQAPAGFQLSYNKQSSEKAICWENVNGFQYYSVDCGEVEPMKYKMTPLYSPDVIVDTYAVAKMFMHNSTCIEVTLADFIYAKLLEYPGINEKHPDQDAASNSY